MDCHIVDFHPAVSWNGDRIDWSGVADSQRWSKICLYSNEPKSFILAFDLALGQGGQCDFETLSAIC